MKGIIQVILLGLSVLAVLLLALLGIGDPNASILSFVKDLGYGKYISKLSENTLHLVVFYGRIAAVIVFLLSAFLFFLIRRHFKIISSYSHDIYAECFQLLKSEVSQLRAIPFIAKCALTTALLILVGFWCFAAATVSLDFDEVYTYLNFSSRGALVSWVYYPYPNNHVLFSIISSWGLHIFSNHMFGVRFFSIISSIVLFFLFTLFTKRKFNWLTAFLSVIFFCSLNIVSTYSYQARGYCLILVWTVIGFVCFLTIIEQGWQVNRAVWIALGVSGVLGLATIPTYIYFFASIIGLLVIDCLLSKRYAQLANTVLLTILVLSSAFLFYLPLLLVSGMRALVANPYVLPIGRDKVLSGLWGNFTSTSSLFFYYDWLAPLFVLFVLTAIAVRLLTFSGRDVMLRNILYACSLFAFPPVWMLLQAVLPFERTWIYLAVPIGYLFAFALQQFGYLLGLVNYRKLPTMVVSGFSAAVVLLAFATLARSYHNANSRTARHTAYYTLCSLINGRCIEALSGGPRVLAVDSFVPLLQVEYCYHLLGQKMVPIWLTDSAPELPSGELLLIHDKQTGKLPDKFKFMLHYPVVYEDSVVTCRLYKAAEAGIVPLTVRPAQAQL